MKQTIPDGNWLQGVDSISYELPQGFYQWSQNITNRGGILSTRQGYAQISGMLGDDNTARGVTLFSPAKYGVDPYIVAAMGSYIYALANPYAPQIFDFRLKLPDENSPGGYITFASDARDINFEVCVQAQQTLADGTVQDIPSGPRFVLIMTDGVTAPAYWYYEGSTSHSGHVTPGGATGTFNIPIGNRMKWVGDRLWIGVDNHLRASDLLNPLQFEEEKVEASGGFFLLPGDISAMGVTHDYKSLLVFTPQTTSAFQVGIEDRTLWPETQDFQREILPEIGCASHRTFVNQYGLSWWASHDGIVSLDSSLQAYVTSRLQVKDHNMSRSKEGVSWDDGGGCAGSFGNWLFFSMPSGSQYNVHTWVLDQSVISTLTSASPPAWCSNWTGLRPEQWVTGIVNGEMRCFCISNDLVVGGHQATVWEAFIGQRMDVPKDNLLIDAVHIPKDIACAVETRYLAINPYQFMRFRYADIDVAEIIGNVDLSVYYCGRRTSYKQILSKRLTAQVSATTEMVFDPTDLINVYVPQFRTVRTVTDSHDADDEDTGIQSPYIRSIDREFSLLITWTGQMSITGLRVCVDPIPDYEEGRCEDDELTVRQITAEGTGQITTDPAPDNTFEQAFTSTYLSPMRPRWIEFPSYDSATGNGVFFVSIPSFDPPAGGYPINTYTPHKDITITTETVGATIVYTTDGTSPSLDPLNGTIYTDPVQITTAMIPATLQARAFRTGLIDSAIETGIYTQAIAVAPVFNPPAGSYPSTDFPKTITITTTTPSAFIRYTQDGTTPSETNGALYGINTPSISAGQTLKAIAYETNYLDSSVTSGAYQSNPLAAETTFSQEGGNYDQSLFPLSVTISTTTLGANIRYTINDSVIADGTASPSPVTVTININDTLRAVAQKIGMSDSALHSGYYTANAQVVEPTFNPEGGTYPTYPKSIVIQTETAGASIRWTINDDNMDDGTVTSSPATVTVNRLDVLRADAQLTGLLDSSVHEGTYS